MPYPKIKNIQQVFCARPWQEISMKTTGEVPVCGAQLVGSSRGYGKADDGKIANLKDHTINQFMNSDTRCDVRSSMIKGKWHEICLNCKQVEETGIKHTQREIIDDKKRILKLIQMTKDDGSIDEFEITRLDVRLSNLCNFACVQCQPSDSSRWYEDHLGFFGDHFTRSAVNKEIVGWHLKKDNRKVLSSMTDDLHENFWSILEIVGPTLMKIDFLGGEPLIINDHWKILDILIDRGWSKNIELFYPSNLSILNQKMLDVWKNFKQVRIMPSMDDIGDRFELIRYGGRWPKMQENLEMLKSSNIMMDNISCCYMIPNIFSIGEIDEWAEKSSFSSPVYRWVYDPFYMSIDSLPRAAKEEIIEHNLKTSTPNSIKMARFMENRIDEAGDPNSITTFVRLMDYLDKSRNQNWRGTLPRLVSFLDKHIGKI